MALVNAFGDLALDTSVQSVKTSVDAITTTINDGVAITASALPTGAATDATLVALQALQQDIADLNENLLALTSALLNAMPRITANKQAAISIEAGSVGISAAQTLATVTTVATVTTCATVTNQAQLGGQEALTVARSQIMAGTNHIYSNLVVS